MRWKVRQVSNPEWLSKIIEEKVKPVWDRITEQKKMGFVPKPASTEQAPSTKWLLDNPDVEFVAKGDAIVEKQDWKFYGEGIDSTIAMQNISATQLQRETSKNTIGQQERATTNAESKVRAIEAYLNIKGIELTEDQKNLVRRFCRLGDGIDLSQGEKEIREAFAKLMEELCV